MKFYSKILLFLFLAINFIACNDMYDVERNTEIPQNEEAGKLLILSEGLYSQNDSRLALFDLESQLFNIDFFNFVNKRSLGDTANEMILHGSKIYILVNVSSQIEVIDVATGVSLKRIPLFNENEKAKQPRYATAFKDKVYVTCFDGDVVRIDTVSLQIDGNVKCGRNPEGICITSEKIYVANSGGLGFPAYDNTVSVIDIPTFKEIKKITVANNPYKVESDSEGDVYVSSRGNYGEDAYRFQRIDTYIDEVIEDFKELHVLNFSIHNDKAYIYNYDFSTQQQWIKIFDCLKEKVVVENFVSDNTHIETPYQIQENPYTGNIYIVDAQNYIYWGDILCFDKNGKLKFRIDEVGLNPNRILFLP